MFHTFSSLPNAYVVASLKSMTSQPLHQTRCNSTDASIKFHETNCIDSMVDFISVYSLCQDCHRKRKGEGLNVVTAW